LTPNDLRLIESLSLDFEPRVMTIFDDHIYICCHEKCPQKINIKDFKTKTNTL
jgi:hypothetical protein